MNKSLIIAAVLLFGPAGQALAEVASCPSRAPDEALKPFRQRTHEYCEVKWNGLSTKPVGVTHDTYINTCARDCYKALGPSAGNVGARFAGSVVAAGLATAGIVGTGISATSGSSSPASP